MNVNYMAKPMQNTVPYKDWNRLILEKNSECKESGKAFTCNPTL